MLKKIAFFILAFLLLLGIVFFIFVQNNKPEYKGTVAMNALDEEVSVYFDEVGVPHIFADNEKDAYKALGYVHAQDRLWQMELMRRIAAGRLAEIFGEDLVETDKLFRSMGLGSVAVDAAQQIDRSSQQFLLSQAYLDGVISILTRERRL